MYNNPILPGFNPDPSIIRVDSDFFLVTSSFEYFPGAPIYHSTDLIRWSLIGHALSRPGQIQIHTPEPGGGVWATTIRYHKGLFYVIAASFERYRPQEDDRVWPRGFYVRTDNVWDSNSWSDPVFFDQVGFDQDLFWDDDGTVYLSSTYRKLDRGQNSKLKDFAVHICTVDLATGNSTAEPKLIRQSPSGIAEGSHLFKHGKYYYLFTAEGGTECGHSEWVSRSRTSPLGPWELGPKNPLWRNGTDDEVQNTGHADLVEDVEGRWWAVMLGVRPVRKDGYWEESVLGRETFLVPVEWRDGWPTFNHDERIALQSTGPELYLFEPSSIWRDGFTNSILQLGWYRKNTPVKDDYCLRNRPGYLRLYGGPYTLSSPTCPTLFLRKQTHRSCTWETQVSFHPTSANTEAGTVVWWNYLIHSSIGIRLSRDTGKRIVRFSPVDGTAIERPVKNEHSDIRFVIECGERYKFGFQEDHDVPIEWIGEVTNRDMTQAPRVGAPFTGMMLGLYAFGELQRSLVPADFAYAEFR